MIAAALRGGSLNTSAAAATVAAVVLAAHAVGSGAVTEAAKMATSSSFWMSLGAPRFVLAPMVDQSELAFR